MWPFRKPQEPIPDVRDLLTRVRKLEEDLGALQLAHERLRGRFYALKGADENQAAKPQSKAEILRRMGFMR